MVKEEIRAKVKSGDRAGEIFTVLFPMPENLDEAKEMWGDDNVYAHMKASVVIALQSFMRQQIQKDNATPESVQTACEEWDPSKGRRGPARPVSERAEELLKRLSPEERRELIAAFLDGGDDE